MDQAILNELRTLIASPGISDPVARDADASVARRYNVIGTPTVIFLDRLGMVRYYGHELPDDYEARLDQLLVRQR